MLVLLDDGDTNDEDNASVDFIFPQLNLSTLQLLELFRCWTAVAVGDEAVSDWTLLMITLFLLVRGVGTVPKDCTLVMASPEDLEEFRVDVDAIVEFVVGSCLCWLETVVAIEDDETRGAEVVDVVVNVFA